MFHSSSLRCGLQTALIWTALIMLFGVVFSSKSSMTEQIYYVDQLKQGIVEEWNKLSQRFIDRSIDEWRRRITRVVQQQSGRVDHMTLWISSSECWNCSNSVNIWCFIVYMTLYWRSFHFFGTPCTSKFNRLRTCRTISTTCCELVRWWCPYSRCS